MSVREVGMQLAVDTGTVRRWIHSGYLPAAKTNDAPRATWRITPEALALLGLDRPTLTVSDAAQLLDVRPATLRGWARRGQLEVVRLGPKGPGRFACRSSSISSSAAWSIRRRPVGVGPLATICPFQRCVASTVTLTSSGRRA